MVRFKYIVFALLTFGAFSLVGFSEQKSAFQGPYLYRLTGGESEFQDQTDKEKTSEIKGYTFDRLELLAPVYSSEAGSTLILTGAYHNEKYRIEEFDVDSKAASLGGIFIHSGNVYVLKSWSHPSFKNKSVLEGAFLTDLDIDWFDGLGYDKVSNKLLVRGLSYPSWNEGLLQLRTTFSDHDGSYLQVFISSGGPARFLFGSYDGERVIQYGYRADETRGQIDDSTVWSHVTILDFF